MPIATPTAESSREIALPDYLQLLLGCFLLALLFCIPIIVYTNHVKRAAATLAASPYSQAAAAEIIAPLNIRGPEALAEAAPKSPLQTAGVLLNARQNQSAGMAPNRTPAPDQRGGDVLASQETGMVKRIIHKFIPTPAARGRSVSLTLFRARSRTNFRSHTKAALIAIWHQTFKQHQN
jgi:hypothetical protein